MKQSPTNLLGLTPDELADALGSHFEARGQPAYRARQVARWVFAQDARSPAAMTDLPVAERSALARAFTLDEPIPDTARESVDGTVKHLWRLARGDLIESVLIPAGGRLTLCVSSQAGCALRCSFCATGWSGFARQLTVAEIAGQYRASARWARDRGLGRITNVVFMGMGEPLANRKAVLPALTVLNRGYGLGARRITVSTVGVIPGIDALAERPEQFRLALSLHAPVSDLRRRLVPLERRYPLPALARALDRFNRRGGRRVTFEYTLIDGVNDDLELVPPLVLLARRAEAFVNLIPFNPIPYVDWSPSPGARVREFQRRLEAEGVPARVREPRGRDIEAACGQLRAEQGPVRGPGLSCPTEPRAATETDASTRGRTRSTPPTRDPRSASAR